MLSRERRIHHGISFDLWTGQRSWFWKLSDRGAIGVALSQPRAIHEACIAIDELFECKATFETTELIECCPERWNCVLDRLAEYVTAA